MKTAIEPLVYTATEAAQALRTRPDLVLLRLERGEIPGKREGTGWKIPKTLLQAYIENEAIREAKERRKAHEKIQDKKI